MHESKRQAGHGIKRNACGSPCTAIIRVDMKAAIVGARAERCFTAPAIKLVSPADRAGASESGDQCLQLGYARDGEWRPDFVKRVERLHGELAGMVLTPAVSDSIIH